MVVLGLGREMRVVACCVMLFDDLRYSCFLCLHTS